MNHNNKTQHQQKDSVILSEGDNYAYLIGKIAKFGKIYRLNPLIHSSGHSCIADFAVIDTLQCMTPIQCSALLFALNSPLFYSTDTASYKTVFAPYIAIEAKGIGKSPHYLLLSYNNKECALANDDEVLVRKKYDNHQFFLSFGLSLFPNDKYLKTNYELYKNNNHE